MKQSPTSRSKQLLETYGYRVAIVEKWNPFAKIRQDLWGADLLAARAGSPLLAVQCTTTDHMAHRLDKCAELAKIWTTAGATFEVWGWAQRGPRGKKKIWTVKVTPIP